MFWSYNMKISVLDNSLYMRNCLIYVARIGSLNAFKKFLFIYLFRLGQKSLIQHISQENKQTNKLYHKIYCKKCI